MFFVPLIAACCVPRVLLCRRSEPLPAARIRDLFRGCRVILAGVGLTLGTEWIAVLTDANRPAWNAATAVQVAILTLLTAWTLTTVRDVRAAGLPALAAARPGDPAGADPDWLADLMTFARRYATLAGPLRTLVLGVLSWTDDHLTRPLRRHPVRACLLACVAFGAAVGVNQGIREDYHVPVTMVACLLLGTGMFGLITAAGAYLGLIRASSAPLRGARRRALDAAVITCIAVLVPFALRDHLWWLVGSTGAAAGLTQLLQLLAICALAIFAASYSGELAWNRVRPAGAVSGPAAR
jgi:hypothetical protein